MGEIEKTRKEQINDIENIFDWLLVLIILIGTCVYGGLCGGYVVIYFLTPEIVFGLYGIICNIIDYFKARKKFNQLVEKKENKDE